MKYLTMTDAAIAEEVGKRIKSLRLRKNRTQRQISEDTGLSMKAVQNAEKGESKLLTYVKIMRALNALDGLDNFLPEITLSPMQLVKTKGKERKRASGSRMAGRNAKEQ